MQVTLQIVHRLQFASGVEQATDDDVAEHLVADGVVAYAVEERTEHKLRANDLHLGIVQSADETVYHLLLFIYVEQRRFLHLLNEGRGLLHQFLHRSSVVGKGGTKRLDQPLLAVLRGSEDKYADSP